MPRRTSGHEIRYVVSTLSLHIICLERKTPTTQLLTTWFDDTVVSYHYFSLNMDMSRLTRDGTVELVSRDQILRHAREQGNIFPCSADHEQDWQPYPVDPYTLLRSIILRDDHTYIHTYIICMVTQHI